MEEVRLSWGRALRRLHRVQSIHWTQEVGPCLTREEAPILAHAYGRSYGDSCLNEGGLLCETRGLDRFLSFDALSGVVRCEAGVSLAALLELVVPRGWFLPVTPGTRFISVAGAVANDVHGKNHHRAGTFGRCVRRFELVRSDRSRILCSPAENPDLFRATIGGLGLTGFITWVELELRPISSTWMDVESVRFKDLDEFLDLTDASDKAYEYTAAWIDCLSTPPGRGLFLRANHAGSPPIRSAGRLAPLLSVPCEAPSIAPPRWVVRAANAFLYRKQLRRCSPRTVPYQSFFYPLDRLGDWNRLYGEKGFFQYQCVVPSGREQVLAGILRLIHASGLAPRLAVLKRFGEVPSPGLLSFPIPGVTLSADFPNEGERTLGLFRTLDAAVADCGGRLYPAKDAAMAGSSFRRFYPQWEELEKHRDPKFSSSFWRRVTQS